MISAPSFDGDRGPSKIQTEPARCVIPRMGSVEGSEAATLSNCRSDAPIPSAGVTGPMDFSYMSFSEAKARYDQLVTETFSILRGVTSSGRDHETPQERARMHEIAAEMQSLPYANRL